ncbi:helix-turn-helix domain-containing protein [Streptomyces sp. NPDC059373]
MPQHPLPISQIAHLLGICEDDLLALMTARGNTPGDPTLVALTVEEAARRIGIGRTKMYEYVSSGEIPSVTIGRLRRIPAEAVGDFLAKRLTAADFTTAA